jgi:hypothetical protein
MKNKQKYEQGRIYERARVYKMAEAIERGFKELQRYLYNDALEARAVGN